MYIASVERDDAWTWICDWLAQQKPVRQATDVTLDTEEKENSDGEFTFKCASPLLLPTY